MNDIGKFFKSKLIFGKYSLKDLIAKGSFGEVYLGMNILTNKNYAIKIEERFSSSLLKDECYVLLNVKGPGIPSIISFGVSGKYNILVENLLGKSINQIFEENNKRLNLKDTFMFAIQALERIEYVHSKNYLHRDIKPGNFLVGNPDSSQIYLIDFGNARKYRSSRTGKHLKYHKTNIIFGTISFLSLNVLKGIEQTRKDELESLGLIIIYLYTGQLPWSELKFKTIDQALYILLKIRQKISLEEICKGTPIEMLVYMKYVNDLKFGENPDYDYLKTLFLIILKKFGEKNDLQFSWVNKKIVPMKIGKMKKNKSLKDIYINLLHSNFNKKMNVSNSYINTDNNKNKLTEESKEIDIDKQKNISSSENNQNNDIILKDNRNINENYKTIKIIGNKSKNEIEYIQNKNKNNKEIKALKADKKNIDLNSAKIKNLKKVKLPLPNKEKKKKNRNNYNIDIRNNYYYPINNLNNNDKINKTTKNFIFQNVENSNNININKNPNNYIYFTLFKKTETKKIDAQKKSKFNNIKTKIYNNQSLTPLNTFNLIPKINKEYLFNLEFKPALYKSIFSSRSTKKS